MLRSFVHLCKGQRVRSEEVDSELPVTNDDIVHESSAGQTHVAHTKGESDLSSSSAPHGEPREDCMDGGERALIDENFKLVKVDLSQESAGHIGEDACKVKLNVINVSDNLGCIEQGAGAPSTSHSQDGSLGNKKGSSAEVSTAQQQQLQPHSTIITIQAPLPQLSSSDSCKGPETAFTRTVSTISTDSLAEYCRICQLTTDEPLIELGCQCRGELAKAHRACIEQWFNNKGTNKCEVCRHVATNLPAPIAQPLQNFWVWRMSRSYRQGAFRRWQGRGQSHALLVALLILVAGLMFDVLISYYLGASALPVNIIIGVLVVLGLGTAARLVIECCHERSIRRSIRRMEMAADREHMQSTNG